MKIRKNLTSTVTYDSSKETVDNFEGGYQIWFNNIHDDRKEASGLAADFTDAEFSYDTFNEALKAALSFSDNIYAEYEVIIEQFFTMWDEDSEGFLSVSTELLTVDAFTQKEKQLVLTDTVLDLLEEQFPDCSIDDQEV